MIEIEPVRRCLVAIYGADLAAGLSERVESICRKYEGRIPRGSRVGFSERDAVLITYSDQVRAAGKEPLASLREFVEGQLGDLVTVIHLLPFFPSSSDDGFAVMGYRAVDPGLGTWDDVKQLVPKYRLMFDAVINHVSAESLWFRSFLRGDPEYKEYFIQISGSPDLSSVVRPRAQPLLTHFNGMPPDVAVWTTFGADQIDLNYKNPAVLLEALDTLLYYVSQGASLIRLDAVAYLWKEPNTTCVHLPQTHWIVRLFRAVLDSLAPHVALLTETNVTQAENITYFGDGANEAHLVYNFALPPLVLHAFHSGQATTLTGWAGRLESPPGDAAYLNILASHDGIGLNPVRGILTEEEIDHLVGLVEQAGGLISRRTNADGSSSPYEINANYLDALERPGEQIDVSQKLRRFITAHAIMLAFRGLPGIYFHSLFGSRGWPEGVHQTGHNRTINREKLDRQRLEAELSDHRSLRAQIYGQIAHLLTARRSTPALSPRASQRVLEGSRHVFALVRQGGPSGREVLCLHNVSAEPQRFPCHLWERPTAFGEPVRDLISREQVNWRTEEELMLAPFQSMWLTTR